MEHVIFAGLSESHPLKVIHFIIFAPAFIATVTYAIRRWRSTSWLPVAGLVLVLLAHGAFVEFAPRLYFADRWYSPHTHSSDAPRFIDDPTPEGSR